MVVKIPKACLYSIMIIAAINYQDGEDNGREEGSCKVCHMSVLLLSKKCVCSSTDDPTQVNQIDRMLWQ